MVALCMQQIMVVLPQKRGVDGYRVSVYSKQLIKLTGLVYSKGLQIVYVVSLFVAYKVQILPTDFSVFGVA